MGNTTDEEGGIIMLKYKFEEYKNRFSVYVGFEEIGYIDFSPTGDVWIIEDTYVEAATNEKELMLQMIDMFVNEARKKKKKLIVLDSLVKRVFAKNLKYNDIIS